ncbi:hypothetical protein [Clostridium perfringens]|uniref:Uncharacterized protein n=2 Tax=Clostridium perfringens TaxID=1502 RepID=A0AAP6WL45_CLOPF|nr:hypothetical protein [Clostridium perfringens]EDT22501.1 hypothetical protein AC1_1098 [Clostridium perfringens B str. ATCC 3626]MCX0415650.1 hypothetical protein [Clostridium perfringens]MDU3646214.1 hypothetical protein [Clostridium perfringens]NGU29022.1 hypothetical protein [Clostridium perfringens]WEV04007.1 hypothetical protein PL322_08265 [Clostridium perfringens B]
MARRSGIIKTSKENELSKRKDSGLFKSGNTSISKFTKVLNESLNDKDNDK